MALNKKQTWRDYYNPIRGLSMARLVAMEDNAERGQHADLQWFYYHMERSDVTIMSAVARRLAFTTALDWDIHTVGTADPGLAKEQAEFLRNAYERIGNFKEATSFLAHGLFLGFAHLHKVYSPFSSMVSYFEPIEQWFWIKHGGMFGEWRFNPESRPHEATGQVIDRKNFCVLEAPPVFRPISRQFFSKSLAAADWDTALETSANPSIFLIGPPGTTPEKELEYRTVAEQIVSNGRGYLPNGSDVKTVDTAQRSRMPFQERITYCDQQIVMAATGGLLTMLTESGSGTLAGGAHSRGLLELARSDAARISEVFQRDLDDHWLNEFFPGQPHAAYFRFDVPEDYNVPTMLEAVANLNWAGYRVDKSQIEDKTGLKLLDAPAQGE